MSVRHPAVKQRLTSDQTKWVTYLHPAWLPSDRNVSHRTKDRFRPVPAHTILATQTRLMALCLGLPEWAGTRKVKPIWILLKQETVSGSGISWAMCKSAPRSRQITMPAPHRSVFYRPDALLVAQPTASKHWRLSSKQHYKSVPVLTPTIIISRPLTSSRLSTNITSFFLHSDSAFADQCACL